MGQHSAHVEQALSELDNGLRLENADSVQAARKRLTAAGMSEAEAAAALRQRAAQPAEPESVQTDAHTEPPVGRTTPASRRVTAGADEATGE
jgi:hypothetical protein